MTYVLKLLLNVGVKMTSHSLPGKIYLIEVGKVTELDRMEFETNTLGKLKHFNNKGEVDKKANVEEEMGIRFWPQEKRVYKNAKPKSKK